MILLITTFFIVIVKSLSIKVDTGWAAASTFVIISSLSNVIAHDHALRQIQHGGVNPEIHLSIGDKNIIQNYTAVKSKPLTIIIENGYAKHAWCYDYYAKENKNDVFKSSLFNWERINVLHIPKVRASMSTKWVCVVLQKYQKGSVPYEYLMHNYTRHFLYFNLYDTESVKITVNGVDLNVETTNLSVTEYDGVARYSYEEHELVDLNCTREDDDGELLLEYYDAGGVLLAKGDSQKTQHFRSIMRSHQNYYYIVCIKTAESGKEFRYKTTFVRKSTHLDGSIGRAVNISVNGLPLVPKVSSPISGPKLYVYKYIDGDVLNITCQTNTPKAGENSKLHWKSKTRFRETYDESTGTLRTSLNTSNMKYSSHKRIVCSASNSTELATLALVSDIPKNSVRIAGLPLKNVEYQYSKAASQWTIVYQYTVDEILDLTCVSIDRNASNPITFAWKLNDVTMALGGSFDRYMSISKSTKFQMRLDKRHNYGVIQCVGKNKNDGIKRTAEIILKLRSQLPSEVYKYIKEDSEPINGGGLPVIMMIAAGIIVTIILAIGLICWSFRKKIANLKSSYDNFSNQNDDPIPTVSNQWNNTNVDYYYSYIDENVSREYEKYNKSHNHRDKFHPLPQNRQSDVPSEDYYEIDDCFATKNGLAASWKTDGFNNKSTDDIFKRSGLQLNNDRANCDSKSPTNEAATKIIKDTTVREINDNQNDETRAKINDNDNLKQDRNTGATSLKPSKSNTLTQEEDEKYLQPVDVQVKSKRDIDNSLKQEKTDVKLDYAKPYGDVEVNCENDCYGIDV